MDRVNHERRKVSTFNIYHPVGTPVRYWTGALEGEGVESKTTTPAQLLGGHTAVVWVEGHAACVALSHVLPIVRSEPQPCSNA